MAVWYPSKVEIAFGAARLVDPAAIPAAAWIDVTDDVARWTTDRGRSYEFDDIQTGVGSILLHNDDGRYTPGLNPAGDSGFGPARQTAGSSLGGVLPEGMGLTATVTDTVLTCGASLDAALAHPFSYTLTIGGSESGTPKLFARGPDDAEAGPFTINRAFRVDPSTSQTFSFQHYKDSGTGSAMKSHIHWLDSDGVVLSTSSSSNFTPNGTVSTRHHTATSHASARYATISLEFNSAAPASAVFQFTAFQFFTGTVSELLSPANYPNITPGNPVRITMEDSGGSGNPIFYGMTGEWDQNIEDSTVTVSVRDAFEALAEQEIEAVSKEVMATINPTMFVPLSDAADTRGGWQAVNNIDAPGTDYPRTIKGSTAAKQLSEFRWNETGPQDGMPSIYFDPESASVGYTLKMEIKNKALRMYSDTSPAKNMAFGGWFRIRPREHGGRYHNLFAYVLRTNGASMYRVNLTDTGVVEAHIGFQPAAGGSGAFLDVGTTGTYADGEWHFIYAQMENTSGTNFTLTVAVDDDGTNGEVATSSGTSAWEYPTAGQDAYLGGWVNTDNDGVGLARAYLSQWFWARRLLTTDERRSLYAVGAPPAIYPGELESTRLGRVLDVVNWPAGNRDIGTGLSTLVGPNPADTNALDAAKQIAESAGGQVFIAKDGKFTYVNRRARNNLPGAVQALAHSTQTMFENTVTPTIDASRVYNEIRVARATGDPRSASDAESQQQYGIRTLDLDMSVLGDDEAEQAANWFLSLYKEPKVRVGTLSFMASAATNSTLWDMLVDLEVMSDRTLDLSVLGLDQTLFFVERISLTYDQENLTFSGDLELSPADPYLNICKLDSFNYGALDDACVLGW